MPVRTGHYTKRKAARALARVAFFFFTYRPGNVAYNGTQRPYIARLNSDGSLDSKFAESGVGFDYDVYAISYQATAKIVVAGIFNAFGVSTVSYLTRLTYIGTLD